MSNPTKTHVESCGRWLSAKSNDTSLRIRKTNRKISTSRTSKVLTNPESSWSKCLPVIQKIPLKQIKMDRFMKPKGKGNPETVTKYPDSSCSNKFNFFELISCKSGSIENGNDHYELWGTDDEDDSFEQETSSKEPLKILSPISHEPNTRIPLSIMNNNMGSQISCGTSTIPCKRTKTCDVDLSSMPDKDGVIFTQWLQNQVEEFCMNPYEKPRKCLSDQILLSMGKLPNTASESHQLEKSDIFVDEFSQWIDQHVETAQLRNKEQVAPTDVYKQGVDLSQWVDNMLEKYVTNDK